MEPREVKVGDVVTWFDIGPMCEYTGTVTKIVPGMYGPPMMQVQIPGRSHVTTVFICDLEP